MTDTADRIEKKALLKASRERVWRAVTEAKQFGTWFGVEFEGEFAAGRRLKGKMVPTKVDAEIARQQQAYSGIEFVIVVERIEPMVLFSFRWHPYELEPGSDEAETPMTLVTFELEDAAGGTLLTVTESGFDAV